MKKVVAVILVLCMVLAFSACGKVEITMREIYDAVQTENLRNITVVSNPGTEKEVSQSVQAPKGLAIGFRYDEDAAYVFEPYMDAACTESYDSHADTDSDLTIYIKWTE